MGQRSQIKRKRLEYWQSLSWNQKLMIMIFLLVLYFGLKKFGLV